MNKKMFFGLLALVSGTLACRPLIAISWNEFLIISGLIAVLLGPSLYKLIRRAEKFFKNREHKGER
jgi:hypothetical protein